MKRILSIIMASIAIAASPLSAEQLKVLMIGNSFSHSVLVWLPRIAEQAGEDLLLANLMIPGCELKTHAENIAKTEADPGFKPYNYDRKIGTKLEPRTKESIQGALKSEKWDVVTIQAGSSVSWKPDTYSPYGEDIIKTIRHDIDPGQAFIKVPKA